MACKARKSKRAGTGKVRKTLAQKTAAKKRALARRRKTIRQGGVVTLL